MSCGGTGICEHNRRRYYCVPCGGGGICEHGRRRDKCPQCKEARLPLSEKLQPSELSPSRSSDGLQQQAEATPLPLAAPPVQLPSIPSRHRSPPVKFPAAAPPSFLSINLSALQQLAGPMHTSPMPMADPSHIEAMLKNWSQSLLAHASSHAAAAASASLNGSRKKKRAPHNTSTLAGNARAHPKCEPEQQASEPAVAAVAKFFVADVAPVAAVQTFPPPNPLKFMIEGQSVVHSKGCNCKHSHCLKRYCECHAAGARCTIRCRCQYCQNGASATDEPVDVSRIAVTVPLTVLSGCHCKHSHCLKRYCECQAAGARCTSKCRCLACENGRPGNFA